MQDTIVSPTSCVCLCIRLAKTIKPSMLGQNAFIRYSILGYKIPNRALQHCTIEQLLLAYFQKDSGMSRNALALQMPLLPSLVIFFLLNQAISNLAFVKKMIINCEIKVQITGDNLSYDRSCFLEYKQNI